MSNWLTGLFSKGKGKDTDILPFGKSPEVSTKDTENGVARFGGTLREPSYFHAYYNSAKILLNTALLNGELDEYCLPIFYLTRHSLELNIKGLIGMAYEVYDMQTVLDSGFYPSGSAPSTRKRRALEESHDIELLYQNLKIICETLGVEVPEQHFDNVVEFISRYEINPTWSRYNRSRDGAHVDREIVMPIVKLIELTDALNSAVSYDQPDFSESLESELYGQFSSLQSRFEDQDC